jgi:hypothetical protein
VVDFARRNPQLKIEAVKAPGKPPVVVGSYVFGADKVVDVPNQDPDRVLQVCEELRSTTGRKVTKTKKQVYSKVPSVQGAWAPDMRYVRVFVRVRVLVRCLRARLCAWVRAFMHGAAYAVRVSVSSRSSQS